MDSEERPVAVLRFESDEVPGDLLAELERAIVPIWASAVHGAETTRAEILVTANAEIDEAYLSDFPSLRAVVTTGTAFDYVDIEYCRGVGIRVHNTPGYTGMSVAEHAFTLMLAVNRNIVGYDAAARSDAAYDGPLAREMEGKTAGIVGLGDVGSRVARLAQGFGMNVVFVNRSRKSLAGAEQVELDDLLTSADAVFLTLPVAPATEKMIGAAQLARMKSDAILVNISADELVDLNALHDALRRGRLAGAGLDVIGSPAPFRELPRTILTSARAWYTHEAVHRRAATWIDTVRAVATSPDADLNRVV